MFDAESSPITIHHRPRNRNTYISVTREGEVCVRTPIVIESAVRRLLRQKEGWINEKLQSIRNRENERPSIGETIRFRGELYRIEQFPKLHSQIEQCEKHIDIEKYYHRFYRQEAALTLPSRVEHYARKMGLHPSEIRFKKMKRRWGSCDTLGVVTFNTMMMQLSYEHIDYIIVHELAHLRHMNHSKEFHALVRRYLPLEKELRRQLRQISPL